MSPECADVAQYIPRCFKVSRQAGFRPGVIEHVRSCIHKAATEPLKGMFRLPNVSPSSTSWRIVICSCHLFCRDFLLAYLDRASLTSTMDSILS